MSTTTLPVAKGAFTQKSSCVKVWCDFNIFQIIQTENKKQNKTLQNLFFCIFIFRE